MENALSSVLEFITKAIESVYSWVWSPALVGLCLVAGLYFTLRTRFVQVRRFREMFRLLFGSAGKGSTRRITVNHHGKSERITLTFKPMESLLLKIDKKGVQFVDLGFTPVKMNGYVEPKK